MTPSELGIEIEHALLVSILGEQHDNGTVRDAPWCKVVSGRDYVMACGFGSPIIPDNQRWARHCVAHNPKTGKWMYTGPDKTGTGWRSWPSLFDYISRLKDEQL